MAECSDTGPHLASPFLDFHPDFGFRSDRNSQLRLLYNRLHEGHSLEDSVAKAQNELKQELLLWPRPIRPTLSTEYRRVSEISTPEKLTPTTIYKDDSYQGRAYVSPRVESHYACVAPPPPLRRFPLRPRTAVYGESQSPSQNHYPRGQVDGTNPVLQESGPRTVDTDSLYQAMDDKIKWAPFPTRSMNFSAMWRTAEEIQREQEEHRKLLQAARLERKKAREHPEAATSERKKKERIFWETFGACFEPDSKIRKRIARFEREEKDREVREAIEFIEAALGRGKKSRKTACLEREKKSVEANHACHLEAEKFDQVHKFTTLWGIGRSALYETDQPWVLPPPREYIWGQHSFGARSSQQDCKEKDYDGSSKTIVQGLGSKRTFILKVSNSSCGAQTSAFKSLDLLAVSPTWSTEEIGALLKTCLLAPKRDAEPNWCYVSGRLLGDYKIERTSSSCKILWGSLLRCYNAIRNYEAAICSNNYNYTTNDPSYFEMDEEERSRNMLPPVFDLEWCQMMETILKAKTVEVHSATTQMDAGENTTYSNLEEDPWAEWHLEDQASEEEDESSESAVTEVEDSTADSYVPETEPIAIDKEKIDASATLRNLVEDMVRPLLTALRTRVEEEQKHLQKVLAAEMDKVALMLQDIRRALVHSNEARGKDLPELPSQQISVAVGGKRKADMEVDRQAKKQAGNAGRCDLLLQNA